MDHAPRTPRTETLAPMKGPQRTAEVREGLSIVKYPDSEPLKDAT